MARDLDIDILDLVDAMTRGPDMDAWLDPATGRIDELPVESMEIDEELPSYENWLEVPRVETRVQWRWMAEFAAAIDEDDVRRALERAIEGAGAFGRFRRAIEPHADFRTAFERLREERVLAEARDWLEDEGIVATFVRRVPEPAPPPRAPRRLRIGLSDMLLLGAPDGKTELLEGRVPRVLIAGSASEARRIFADVARDVCEAQGVGWRRRFVENQRTYEMGRYHLVLDGTRIDLEVDVSRELWRAFES